MGSILVWNIKKEGKGAIFSLRLYIAPTTWNLTGCGPCQECTIWYLLWKKISQICPSHKLLKKMSSCMYFFYPEAHLFPSHIGQPCVLILYCPVENHCFPTLGKGNFMQLQRVFLFTITGRHTALLLSQSHLIYFYHFVVQLNLASFGGNPDFLSPWYWCLLSSYFKSYWGQRPEARVPSLTRVPSFSRFPLP